MTLIIRAALRPAILVALCLSLTGCGAVRQLFGSGVGEAAGEGESALIYKARLSKGTDRRTFTVSVASRGAGLDEVRESVRFQATGYCLFNYGNSDTEWRLDPATGDWAFGQSGETLTFSGRCMAR